MIVQTATRVHDDNDGDNSQKLTVMITEDGDTWIKTPKMLRFRAPMGGGGNSPKTWKALIELHNAIVEDNEDEMKAAMKLRADLDELSDTTKEINHDES